MPLIPSHGGTLENLFDQENAVAHRRRTDKVFRAIKNDIAVEVDEMADLDPTAFAGMTGVGAAAAWHVGDASR